MPLESATYISELDPTNPVGSSDLVSSLDDHMRLVKATLKNTFPNIDGAVSATEDQINLLAATSPNDRVLRISSDAVGWGQLTAGMFPSQVVPDAALSDNVARRNAPNTFTSGQQAFVGGNSRSNATRFQREASGGNASQLIALWSDAVGNFIQSESSVANTKHLIIRATTNDAGDEGTSEPSIKIRGRANSDLAVFGDAGITLNGNAVISGTLAVGGTITGNGSGLSSLNASNLSSGTVPSDRLPSTIGGDKTFSGVVRAGTVATSTSTTLAAGQVHAVTGNATLPNMTAGQWVGVINNSASPITVTKNASDTMYWTASGASVTSVTVAARGKATFFCADGTNVYASGNITGAS